ncbi:hypothetical protein MMC07_002876 [Pseudocyphellaria aurata]|nr:hypothetical protein [Pseudocyphellaria aurata]
MDEALVKAFRSLKPPCVELSQLVLRFKSKSSTGKQVVKSTESLCSILQDISRQPNALNEKLGEYAFFPLSHIFRDSKELPTRAVEVALQCLDILITCAWRSHISSELGKQLLILLSFLAGGNSVAAETEHVNEELGAAAFQCLRSLFSATGNAGLGEKAAIESENIPILGHAITVVLDGMNNGPSARVRLAASNALDSMIVGISDLEALRNFFPGIVSSLTKVVRPGSGPTVSFKLLQISVLTLEKILNKVISDQATSGHVRNLQQSDTSTSKKQKTIDSWVKATSSQVKLALANIIPLQYHERFEVRITLFQLCINLLQNCKNSLHQSIPMMVETLIVLCSQNGSENALELIEKAKRIFLVDDELLELSKSSLHDWILALPRVMQSNNEGPKRKSIARISTAFQLISAENVNSDILNDAIAFNLRASVSSAIQASSSQKINAVPEGSLQVTKLLQSSSSAEQMVEFQPVVLNGVSQRDSLNELRALARQLKVLPISDKLQKEIIKNLRMTSGDEQLASLWLSLQLLSSQSTASDSVEQYLNIPDDPEDNDLLDEVYSFSLDTLSRPAFEDESNWKQQALALEIVALQAQHQKRDFRPELVDALYPILERMGSSNAALQHHAMTCLSLVSSSCAYPSPGALIIDNADYLVNAVALKLNTFDISPQAPQVLVMMVKLCGPGLIPYLDDLVESIFSILACYHGYPRLVESLFAVLHAIVEESAKSPLLAIGPASAPIDRQPTYQPTDVSSVATRLRKLNTPTADSSPPSSSPPSPHPSDPNPQTNDEASSPPAPTVLLNTISLLTQHHLTTTSLPLLLSLLSLLAHAFPPLSTHPDTLLPLLATLFPLLMTRLHHDASPRICIVAAEALSAACRAGGDFLASRFHDEWDGLRALHRKYQREMRAERKMMGPRGGGSGGLKHRAWEAVRGVVRAVVEWVGVTGGPMEDGAFEMLGGEGAGGSEREGESGDEATLLDPDTRALLHGLNPDRLWLLDQRTAAAAGRRINGKSEGEGGDGDGDAWLKAPKVPGWILKDVRF